MNNYYRQPTNVERLHLLKDNVIDFYTNESAWWMTAGSVAVCALTAYALFWMPQKIDLCENDGPGQITSYSAVFNGGPDLPVCTVDTYGMVADYQDTREFQDKNRYSSKQKTSKKRVIYRFDQEGLLIVNGHVPDRVSLSVPEGRMEINGDIGDGSSISATLPYETRTEFYTYTCGSKPVRTCTGTRQVFDHYRYRDDFQAAVIIRGYVGESIVSSSAGGIEITKDVSDEADISSARERPVVINGQRIKKKGLFNR